MQPNATPIRNPIIVLREEFDDWAVLFNPDTAEAVGINPIAVVVWKQIDDKRSLEQITTWVREHYSSTPDSVEQDISSLMDDFVQKGFVGLTVD